MSELRFCIRKLCLKGEGKKDAVIEFCKGLNIITGPSNTGKTYVYQCINYMFGGQKIPKAIDESIGYKTIYLEIGTSDGKIATFEREIGKNKVYLYECEMNKICNKINSSELMAKHTKDKDSISTELLDYIDIEGWRVRTNDKGNTKSFTFRNIVQLTMLDETRIISEHSPIHSGQVISKTSEFNSFKAIITGKDDSDCQLVDDKLLYKSKIEGQVELIRTLIQEYKDNIEDNKNHVPQKYLNEEVIDRRIKELSQGIEFNKELIEEKMNLKKKIWEINTVIKDKINLFNERIYKFSQLKDNYLSDLKRLEFVVEANFYTSQLTNSQCPLCNNIIIDQNIQFYKDNFENNQNDIEAACLYESEKITRQTKDLNKTIELLVCDLNKNNLMNQENNKEIKSIDESILNELTPKIDEEEEKLFEVIKYKEHIQKTKEELNRIERLKKKQTQLLELLSKKPKKEKYDSQISDRQYEDFCEEVKQLLEKWNYDDAPYVAFDRKNNDLIISGKYKNSFGKGYRAVLNSAFIIALMKYTYKNDLTHPGFVILDSPLTTFKDKKNEEIIEGEIEKINLSINDAFFENLSQIDSDLQIIIFENKEPKKDIIDKINYIEYTKIFDDGEYGFIPMKE